MTRRPPSHADNYKDPQTADKSLRLSQGRVCNGAWSSSRAISPGPLPLPWTGSLRGRCLKTRTHSDHTRRIPSAHSTSPSRPLAPAPRGRPLRDSGPMLQHANTLGYMALNSHITTSSHSPPRGVHHISFPLQGTFPRSPASANSTRFLLPSSRTLPRTHQASL